MYMYIVNITSEIVIASTLYCTVHIRHICHQFISNTCPLLALNIVLYDYSAHTNWNFVLRQMDDFLIPAVGLLKLKLLPTLIAVVVSVFKVEVLVAELDKDATPLPWKRQLTAFFFDSASTCPTTRVEGCSLALCLQPAMS